MIKRLILSFIAGLLALAVSIPAYANDDGNGNGGNGATKFHRTDGVVKSVEGSMLHLKNRDADAASAVVVVFDETAGTAKVGAFSDLAPGDHVALWVTKTGERQLKATLVVRLKQTSKKKELMKTLKERQKAEKKAPREKQEGERKALKSGTTSESSGTAGTTPSGTTTPEAGTSQ